MNRITVTVSRTIPASPAAVFDAWLDPRTPGAVWFGAEQVILDPKVDALYYHRVRHLGRAWAHYGRFLRLERGRVIEHTWMSEATQGIETTVTVTLEPAGEGTRLTLRHADLPDDELGRSHEGGWTMIAEAVDKRVASRPR